VRTVVFGFGGSFKTIVGRECRRAHLAARLGEHFAVVVVQISVRRFAERALFCLRDRFSAAKLDGFELPALLGLMSFQQRSVI